MQKKNRRKSPPTIDKNKKTNGGKRSYPATGKLIYLIHLKLDSPLIIGCGEDEHSDLDVIRDASGKPLIPATSLIGVFSSYLEKGLENQLKIDSQLNQNFQYLFGYREKLVVPIAGAAAKKETPQNREYQSALQCDDVILKDADNPVVRDGVKIDPATNTAEDKGKYNYEVVEKADDFTVNLEITLRADFDKAVFKKLINTICQGIKQGNIRLGAKTNKGFGKLELLPVELAELNFDNGTDVYQWLSGDYNYSPVDISSDCYEILNRKFTIDAWFKIKNSFLIKSYSDNPADPDSLYLKRGEEPVLPGTSVMGAIQHRALRILKTIAIDQSKVPEKMDKLFGFVRKEDEIKAQEGEGEKKPTAQKGRLLVEETIIDRNYIAEKVQTRIKIDRFTGGTVSGALFEMMPLWPTEVQQENQKENHQAVHIVMTVMINNSLEWAPGLLLLILKDLWTGDLPIGGEKNVGRGVLQGVSAEIYENNDKKPKAKLTADGKGGIADPENVTKLEPFVTKLWEELNNGQTTKK